MRWVRVKGFAVAYVRAFFREKAAVFWVIVWPLLLLLMTAYVFIPPAAGKPMTMDVGVVNYDVDSKAPFNGTMFVKVLESIEYNGTKLFNVKLYDNETALREDMKKGRLDAGIIIPRGFGVEIMIGQAKLTVLVGGESVYDFQINRAVMSEFLHQLSTRVALEKIRESMKYIELYAPKNISVQTPSGNVSLTDFVYKFMIGLAVPVNATVEEVAPKTVVDRSFLLGWYALGALGMMLLYTGFNIGSTAVVEERQEGRLRRIMSTPATEADMLVGKTLGGLAVLAIASLIIVLAAVFVIHAKIKWSPLRPVDWLVPLHLLLMSLMTISMGFILSLASKTAKGASSLATTLGLILAFTAGIWFPRDWMPGSMKMLAEVFPVTWSLDVVRDIVVREASLGEVIAPTIKCLIATIVILVLGVLAYRKSLRRYVEL